MLSCPDEDGKAEIQQKALTDHFVLLSVPDGSAEQTLNLVVCVIWILPLSQEHERNTAAERGGIKHRETKKKERKTRYTDCPGEALVLGHVSDVERQHGVLDILSVHVVNLADVAVPAETRDIAVTTGHKDTRETRKEESTRSEGPQPAVM